MALAAGLQCIALLDQVAQLLGLMLCQLLNLGKASGGHHQGVLGSRGGAY